MVCLNCSMMVLVSAAAAFLWVVELECSPEGELIQVLGTSPLIMCWYWFEWLASRSVLTILGSNPDGMLSMAFEKMKASLVLVKLHSSMWLVVSL